VEGTPAEAIVRRAVFVGGAIVRHCSPGRGGQWIWGEAGECGRPDTRYIKAAGINSPRRVAGRPSAAAFTACGRRCAGKMTMRGRRDDEDNDRSLLSTCRGDTTRGKFLRRFARFCFVRSPRARPGRPGMSWARRMDEGPNPGEIEEPGARLGRYSPSR
jgi:hypothetical protein